MTAPRTQTPGIDDVDRVLVTNDDGIESTGLAVIADRLSEHAAVTVVAPDENVSGIGRTRSREVTYERTERGYAVDGTPADCVAFGARALDRSFDAVVSGCNHGPNAGAYLLGRSGTVGAAVEAAWLGIPGVAVSAYHPETVFARPADEFAYDAAAAAVEHLLPALVESVDDPDGADLVTVNAPVERDPPMRITEPAGRYDTSAVHDGDAVRFEPEFRPRGIVPASDEGSDADDPASIPDGTEQGALRDGVVGVSPLTVPVEPVDCSIIQRAVAAYNEG